jgi:nitrate/nitrite transport system ATP-binding protein
MTNGTDTAIGYDVAGDIGETEVNSLPKSRTHARLQHLDGYYALRNHIIDFLIKRARPDAHP